jgi:serine protease Do
MSPVPLLYRTGFRKKTTKYHLFNHTENTFVAYTTGTVQKRKAITMSEEWDNRKNHTDTDPAENTKPEEGNISDTSAENQEAWTDTGGRKHRIRKHRERKDFWRRKRIFRQRHIGGGRRHNLQLGESQIKRRKRGFRQRGQSMEQQQRREFLGDAELFGAFAEPVFQHAVRGNAGSCLPVRSYDSRSGSNPYQNSTQYQNSAHGQNYAQQGNPYQGSSYQGQPYQQNPYADPNPSSSRKNRRKAERAARRAARKAGRSQAGAGTGRKWTTVVAMALVFGLVAGTVTYGVNAIANRIHPIETTADNSSSGTADSGNSGSGSKDSGSGNSGKDALSSTTEGTGSSDTSSSSSASSGASGTADGTVADVAANCMPSLVTISTMSVEEMQSFFGGSQKYQVQGAGSGVIIGQNDTELLIATNNHVVSGATSLSVGFIDETVVEAAIKGTDADNDLAVVAVQTSDIPEDTQKQLKVATIGSSDELALGDQIVAIGNALGYGQSVTAGYVSAKNRTLELSDGTNTFTSTDLIQIDAAINSGNSGGALFNMKGELVGINEAKSSSTSSGATVDNMGYAIPIDKAEPILEQLMTEETKIAYSEDEQGYLGITAANVTSEYSQMYDMPEGVGITSVVSGGPAEQGGLQKGDIITKIAGTTVSDFDDLQNELRYHKSGEMIEITYERADNGTYKENTANVTLGTKDVLSSINAQNNGNN